MSDKALKEAIAFFARHAGYCYNPLLETREEGRQRCAEEYANAERVVYGDWEYPILWAEDDDAPGWCARVTDHDGDELASLYGIDLGEQSPYDRNCTYARVVGAELAMEAMMRIAEREEKRERIKAHKDAEAALIEKVEELLTVIETMGVDPEPENVWFGGFNVSRQNENGLTDVQWPDLTLAAVELFEAKAEWENTK